MSTTRPSKPSSRRVAAALPPARPPPTITIGLPPSRADIGSILSAPRLGRGTLRQPWPTLDRVGRANNVHTCGGVALESGVRLVRVVDDARHDDRGRAVLE